MMRVHPDFYEAVRKFSNEFSKSIKTDVSHVEVTKLFASKDPYIVLIDKYKKKKKNNNRYDFRRLL